MMISKVIQTVEQYFSCLIPKMYLWQFLDQNDHLFVLLFILLIIESFGLDTGVSQKKEKALELNDFQINISCFASKSNQHQCEE